MHVNAEILAESIRKHLTKTGDAEAGAVVPSGSSENPENEGARFAIDTPLGSFVIEVEPV